MTKIVAGVTSRHSTSVLARLRASAALAVLCWAATAQAAGGHHAVDDAAILEPGLCQLEAWLKGAQGGERLAHGGAGCRVGPVELTAASEHTRDGIPSQTISSLQAKWATQVAPRFGAGLSMAGDWRAHVRPHHPVTTIAALLTWAARDDLALHANLGRDFVRAGSDLNRSGVAAEWTARPGWSLTAERYVEDRTQFVRAAVRWSVSDAWSIDLSRAQRLRGPSASNWTLGTTWQFERP
jgi:hypothetical protein